MNLESGNASSCSVARDHHRHPTLSRYHPGQFADSLREKGFVCISPADWGVPLVEIGLADWASFAQSWERLDRDRWMADGGQYRRRRFAAFAVEDGKITRKSHQAHYQSRRHNRLNGGFPRWFAPVEPAIGDHRVTSALLRIGEELANALTGWDGRAWHAELHQFRIEATQGIGWPTPEGLHRDGVAAVLMMLIQRYNVTGGVTTITEEGRFIAEVALSCPGQGLFLDDRRLQHCVSPVVAADDDRPGWRDALVLTFRPDRTFPSSAFKETHHG